jgi:hypothetical protein
MRQTPETPEHPRLGLGRPVMKSKHHSIARTAPWFTPKRGF